MQKEKEKENKLLELYFFYKLKYEIPGTKIVIYYYNLWCISFLKIKQWIRTFLGRNILTLVYYYKAFRALRAHLLFQLWIVALSLSIFSLYSIKKKFANFIIFFRAFSKFFKNKKLLNTIPGVTWGPTHNLGPIGLAVLTFIGYKQTARQTS